MTRPPHAASSVVGYASDTASAVAKVEPNSNRSRETGRPYTIVADDLAMQEAYVSVAIYWHCCWNISSSLSGVPDYFGRNKISSGGDLSHYSSASLY